MVRLLSATLPTYVKITEFKYQEFNVKFTNKIKPKLAWAIVESIF